MQITKVWQVLNIAVAVLVTPLWAQAQQQAQPAQTPSASGNASSQPKAQPKLEKLEEGEPPSIKLGKPEDQRKITETREDGKVKEVKVQTGKSTYYLKPNEQVGSSLPGDTQSTTNRGAEWKVMEFDLGSKNKKEKEGDGTAPADESAPAEPKK